MAALELGIDMAYDVRILEGAALSGDLDVHGHLHQQIAQLLTQLVIVLSIEGLQGFVGLLQQVVA